MRFSDIISRGWLAKRFRDEPDAGEKKTSAGYVAVVGAIGKEHNGG